MVNHDLARWQEEREDAAVLTDAGEANADATAEALRVDVGGDTLPCSVAVFEYRCKVWLSEEQRKVAPDNALIALICDAVRLSREHVGHMQRCRIAIPETPELDLMRRKAEALDLLEAQLRREWRVALYLMNDRCSFGVNGAEGSTLLEAIERAKGTND